MRITNTPDILIIDNRLWVLAVMLSGVALGVLNWMISALMGGQDVLAVTALVFAAWLGQAHIILVVDQGMDAGSYQITRLVKSRKNADALIKAINDWLAA
jgi:hypothetical protein